MKRRKKPRPKRRYDKQTVIAEFQRLPPKQRRLFIKEMRQWLHRAGYLLLLLSAMYFILQSG